MLVWNLLLKILCRYNIHGSEKYRRSYGFWHPMHHFARSPPIHLNSRIVKKLIFIIVKCIKTLLYK